jgi:hypothetical protein
VSTVRETGRISTNYLYNDELQCLIYICSWCLNYTFYVVLLGEDNEGCIHLQSENLLGSE